MIEFYPQIKAVHVFAVLASGAVFLLRGLLVQTGQARVAMAAPLRWLSYGVDTVLLTAALMLLTLLPGGMFENHWLSVKLALLVAYVALGSLALKRAPTRRTQALSLAGAALVYLLMLGIARAHHPLGWMALQMAVDGGVRPI